MNIFFQRISIEAEVKLTNELKETFEKDFLFFFSNCWKRYFSSFESIFYELSVKKIMMKYKENSSEYSTMKNYIEKCIKEIIN